MNRQYAIEVLKERAEKGAYVFTKHELAKLFLEDNQKSFDESLRRLIKSRILRRASRGVYVNENAASRDSYTIERVAIALRTGEYNYVSLESMLSEYGVISQIPMDRLTVMTTGRKGIYVTPYGIIEFTHTKRSIPNIIENIRKNEGRPLRLATKEAAVRDLKRIGRNTSLINQEELNER